MIILSACWAVTVAARPARITLRNFMLTEREGADGQVDK